MARRKQRFCGPEKAIRAGQFATYACALMVAGCGDRPSPTSAASEEATSGPEDSALAAHVAPEDSDAVASPLDELAMTFGRVWEPWFGDFDAMAERRIVRAVVPYGGYQYFYEDGKPRGAAYEMLRRLESHINAELGSGHLKVYVIIIPVGRDRLLPAVLEGHADLAAGDLTATDSRTEALTFTRPWLDDIDEVIVTGPSARPITNLDDLAGQPVIVRPSSSYFEHLQGLANDFGARGLDPPAVIPADELLEAEDLLEMVNAGLVPMTVMDDYKAEFWASVFPEIVVRHDLVINAGGAIGWAHRSESPAFAAMLGGFMQRYGKGTLVGNDTYNRYLSDAARVRCAHSPQSLATLEPLIDVFRQYAGLYEFDWLMLAAQAYQESGLDQARRSQAGAVGLMQIRPSTAADPNVAVPAIETVDGNVHAGTKYLRFLADRYFSGPGFDPLSQWLFSLAAYNAGPARVAALRRDAAAEGYDPNRWFNNVEIVAAREIGRETVTYVSNVFKYYVGYQLTATRGAERTERFDAVLSACAE